MQTEKNAITVPPISIDMDNCNELDPKNETKSRNEAIKIVYVAAASTHSIALSSYGEVFTWGSINHGKLGLDAEIIQTVN